MPLLKLHTSEAIPGEKSDVILGALSRIIATAIGKPETYVMVTLTSGPVCMSGDIAPGAFADVRSIGGLNGVVNKQISEQVCALLNEQLGIDGNRVYLNFSDVDRSNWGWDSGTFG